MFGILLARRKNRWLAEKSVVLEHAQAVSADNLREPVSKMSEHFVKGSIEKQRLFWIFAQMELLPVVEKEDQAMVSTFQMLAWFCRFLRVLFLTLLFLFSVDVEFIISVPSTASGSICYVYLQYTFCCRFWCTDDLTQWTHHNWKVSQVFLSFLS